MFGNGYTLGATEKGSKWRHFACVPWFCKKIIWLETIHSRFRTPVQKKRGGEDRAGGRERERESVWERERVTLVENRVWCDNIDTTAVGNGADTGDISLLNQLFLFCFFISRTKTTSLTRSTLCSRRQLPTLTYEGWSSWPRSTGLVYRPARQIPDRTARDPQCPAPSAGRFGWRWEWPPVRSFHRSLDDRDHLPRGLFHAGLPEGDVNKERSICFLDRHSERENATFCYFLSDSRVRLKTDTRLNRTLFD